MMTLVARLLLVITGIAADMKLRPIRGYLKVTTSTVIDTAVTQFVSVANGGTAVTITLKSNTAKTHLPVWVKRFDSTSTGNITITATTGTVESPSGGLLATVIMLISSPRQYGYCFNGTNWELITQ